MSDNIRIPLQQSFFEGRTIVWFSCGVASACAAKLAAQLCDRVEVVNCGMEKDEHPDSIRFKSDVERWIDHPITTIRSNIYSSIDDVFSMTRYMSGIEGARCSTEMKKIPRHHFEYPGDIHVFGFTSDEPKRIKDFEKNNPDLYLRWILREAGLTKEACFEMVKQAGIEIPVMYKLGFKNNNYEGCVKATSPKYWNMIRTNFPEVFKARATRSRELGVKLVRLHNVRVFLDELPADETEEVIEDLSCGPQCGIRGNP